MVPCHLGRHRGVFLAAALLVSGLIPALLLTFGPSRSAAGVNTPLSAALLPAQTSAAHSPADVHLCVGSQTLTFHEEALPSTLASSDERSGCRLTFVPAAEMPFTPFPTQIAVRTPGADVIDAGSPSPLITFPEPFSAGLMTFGALGLLLRKHLRRPTFRRS